MYSLVLGQPLAHGWPVSAADDVIPQPVSPHGHAVLHITPRHTSHVTLDPHLPLPVVVRLVVGPVGVGPEAGAVRPGERALVKEVLQPHPAHLAPWHDEDT